MAKRVYLLSEARGLSRDLLGGKGHGLAEMAAAKAKTGEREQGDTDNPLTSSV